MRLFNAIVISTVLILASCRSGEEVREEAQYFPVTQLTTRDTIVEKEYIGDIHAFRKTEIRARVQGYLEEIYVDEGQEVKKDQLLFRINAEEYNANLAQSKAALTSAIAEVRTAALEYDRVKLLVDKNVVSPTDLDVAKAKVDVFNAKVEEARSVVSNASLKLAHAVVRAPFDGTIDRIPFKIGSLIDEGILLTTVSDVRFIYVYFKVSENEYLRYMQKKLQQEDNIADVPELVLADGTVHQYKGKIETMEGEFESSTGTIAFRALFPNPDKILKHGASGKVKIGSAVKNALMVPQKSTFEIQNKTYVYVVSSDNKVKMKSFTPGVRLSHFYIVENGLSDGDRIVYEGIQSVKDGMTISALATPIDSLITLSQDRQMMSGL